MNRHNSLDQFWIFTPSGAGDFGFWISHRGPSTLDFPPTQGGSAARGGLWLWILARNRIYGVLGLLLVLSSGLLSGCNLVTAAREPDQVTIQLSWFHTAEFAGFYIAEEKGYYRDENLAVTLVAGSPEIDPVAEVVNGRTQFGVTTGEGIIRAQAAQQDVVAVASIFRQSPVVVMTLADSQIRQPEDLVGKTVGVVSPEMDSTWDVQFLAMLNKLGIDPTSMTFVPIEDYHGANELVSGRTQAHTGAFSTTEPVQAKLDGHETELIFLSDYGIEMYVNPIFTTGSLSQERPDLVERFVRATLKGYQYALEEPEEAADLTLRYDETVDVTFQRAVMRASIPLIDTGDAPVGTMDGSVWQITQDILLEQKLISEPIDLNTVYTNEFVEKAR